MIYNRATTGAVRPSFQDSKLCDVDALSATLNRVAFYVQTVQGSPAAATVADIHLSCLNRTPTTVFDLSLS